MVALAHERRVAFGFSHGPLRLDLIVNVVEVPSHSRVLPLPSNIGTARDAT
jgi:hypothetical protein